MRRTIFLLPASDDYNAGTRYGGGGFASMDRFLKPNSYLHAFYYAAAILATIFYLNSAASDFIYFQF